jgi:predicted membrane channel-forming protein YqfA (hemolysin III family)
MVSNKDTMKSLFTSEEIDKTVPVVPRWPLIVQALSAVAMLTFSAFYHLFLCKCCDLYETFLKVDLAGICIMIAGSATAPLFYTLMCD